jgi:hypothetical protein
VLIFLSFFCCLTSGLPAVVEQRTELDRNRLETIEDRSESLANALLDFSVAVRDRDLDTVRGYFPEELATSKWPVANWTERDRVKWIVHSVPKGDLSAVNLRREASLANWRALLDSFSAIEDVRFKVKDAGFDEASEAQANDIGIKYFLVGQTHDRQRMWIKGTAHLEVSSLDNRWLIRRFELDSVDLYRCRVELFTEVSEAAGLARPLPAYGTPGNDDFIYHGGAAGDLDQDGFIDLVVTSISGIAVYLNRADGTFLEVGEQLGLPQISRATAPLLLDYDNDGDLDVFLAAVGNQSLFQNRLQPDGKLRFEDYSIEAGISRPANGYGATVGDINNDGLPDVYVACYNRFGTVMPNSWHQATNGTPNLLFVNQGQGVFRELAQKWGVRDTRWSYAAQFADFNADGRQDLYVANDFGENGLYLNQGDRFLDRAAENGALDPGNGMGISSGDFNNDGNLDLFVTNMSSTAGNRILNRLYPGSRADDNTLRKLAAGSSLFQGDSTGRFQDVTASLGPFSTGWAWGGIYTDFDNDGWQDLYCASGFLSGKTMKDT